MPTDNDSAAARPKPQAPPAPARYARGERLRRLESWVPAAAVSLVAVVAVSTAFLSQRHEAQDAATPLAPTATETAEKTVPEKEPAPVTVAASDAPGKLADKGVVTAPPLKPPPKTALRTPVKNNEQRAATQALGGAAACRNCGVVETVVAVHGYAQPLPSGYQMHIRMDDGSMRTVEQRGALAAGSRVVVERDSVKALAAGAG
jgi:type IV secretory pathway VirB10-like protein